jgi:hypothetical protein
VNRGDAGDIFSLSLGRKYFFVGNDARCLRSEPAVFDDESDFVRPSTMLDKGREGLEEAGVGVRAGAMVWPDGLCLSAMAWFATAFQDLSCDRERWVMRAAGGPEEVSMPLLLREAGGRRFWAADFVSSGWPGCTETAGEDAMGVVAGGGGRALDDVDRLGVMFVVNDEEWSRVVGVGVCGSGSGVVCSRKGTRAGRRGEKVARIGSEKLSELMGEVLL